jgi:hypothetical protein
MPNIKYPGYRTVTLKLPADLVFRLKSRAIQQEDYNNCGPHWPKTVGLPKVSVATLVTDACEQMLKRPVPKIKKRRVAKTKGKR